jgi:glycosyltransferase involved in cell wall biosynthesis
MKILYVVESAATGVARNVLDLVDGAIAAGHRVSVIYSPRREDGIFRAGRERLAAAGVEFTPVLMRRAPGPWDLAPVLAVRRYIGAKGPFDVIHGHSSKGGMIARLAGIGAGAQIVYTPHAISTLDPDLPWFKRVFYHAGETVLSWLTDILVAVSMGEGAHLESLGIPRRKIRVVPNGAEPPRRTRAREAVRAELGLTADQVAIGFVGRLGRHKAIDVMVAAFAQTLAKHPDTRLIVIGDGEWRDRAKRQAVDLGCDGAISWLGARESLSYYAGFDLLALPSRYEGFSYTMLEAAGIGLPVVATDVSGTRDLIDDGKNGIVVPRVGDVAAFAAALAEVAGDKALRESLANEATSRIRTGDVGRMVAGTLAVYAGARTKD